MSVIIQLPPPPLQVPLISDPKTNYITGQWYNWLEQVYQAVGGDAAPVLSFNSRQGNITLESTDVSTALGYVPAGLSSPAFNGTPTAPTPGYGDNTNTIATTAFVEAAVVNSTSIQGYGTGSGTDKIFFINGQTVNGSFAIPTNYNAGSVGPITIGPGVTVTISPNSKWLIQGISTGGAGSQNIIGGAAGEVVYQSDVNITAFTAAGTAGQSLHSAGTSAPYWTLTDGRGTGGGTDQVFFLNAQTINTSYTIPTTTNAMTCGNIAVAVGATITVPPGSSWTSLG